MKDQFCSYEISLALKELGFNEKCFSRYDNSGNLLGLGSPSIQSKNSNLSTPTAPLWQQAIDFLKENSVLVAERWDGWEYGAYEWDEFIYCESKEQAILKAIELIKNETTTN